MDRLDYIILTQEYWAHQIPADNKSTLILMSVSQLTFHLSGCLLVVTDICDKPDLWPLRAPVWPTTTSFWILQKPASSHFMSLQWLKIWPVCPDIMILHWPKSENSTWHLMSLGKLFLTVMSCVYSLKHKCYWIQFCYSTLLLKLFSTALLGNVFTNFVLSY